MNVKARQKFEMMTGWIVLLSISDFNMLAKEPGLLNFKFTYLRSGSGVFCADEETGDVMCWLTQPVPLFL